MLHFFSVVRSQKELVKEKSKKEREREDVVCVIDGSMVVLFELYSVSCLI